MEKVDLGKPTTLLDKEMSRKELYLDYKKADKLRDKLLKQFDVLSKTLSSVGSTMEKLSQKNAFQGDTNNLSLQCARKCSSQAQAANSLISNLDLKYNDDVKSILIKNLDERLSYLEDAFLNDKN